MLLAAINDSHMNWKYNDPELAIAGTMLRGFEFLFVGLALVAFAVGIVVTYRGSKKS